jgi:hypothetical protein
LNGFGQSWLRHVAVLGGPREVKQSRYRDEIASLI